jgi:apolipoprotein N-acyltransferase
MMLVSLILALLFVVGFNIAGLWWLAFASVAIFLLFMKSIKHAFAFGFLINLILFSFMRIHVGVIPWIAAALCQTSIYLVFYLAKFLPILWRPALWYLSEFLAAHFWFGGFGLVRLGYLLPSSFHRQIAFYGGHGTALLLLYCLFFLFSKRYQSFLLLIPLLILPTLFTDAGRVGSSVKLNLVQGGVGAAPGDYQRLITIANKGSAQDLLLLPENVVHPGDAKFVSNAKTPFIVGSVNTSANGFLTNDLVDRNGSVIYRKRHLTPFGEYIPFASVFRHLNSHSKEVVDFKPGRSQSSFDYGQVMITPLICYDLFDSGIVASQLSTQRPSIIYVATNNQTFLGTPESEYEFRIARMWAMQYGRDLAYVSTTGPSALINESGEIISRAPENLPEILPVIAQAHTAETVSTRIFHLG